MLFFDADERNLRLRLVLGIDAVDMNGEFFAPNAGTPEKLDAAADQDFDLLFLSAIQHHNIPDFEIEDFACRKIGASKTHIESEIGFLQTPRQNRRIFARIFLDTAGKPTLCAEFAGDGFQQEIRDPEDLKIPAGGAKPNEIKMAIQLINQLTTDFNIARYKDTYSDKLLKLIKAKDKGKKITQSPLRVVHSRSKDLMDQLKASLQPSKRKAS